MFEGLRDAFEYVTGLKEEAMEPIVTEIEGKTYCNQSLVRYGKEELADSIRVNTLSAMIDYIKGMPEELREVGKWIPPGVGVGIEDSMPELEKQTDKEMEALADRMQAAVNLETGKISIDKNTSQTYKVDRDSGQSFGDRKTEVVIEGETHVHVDLDGKEIAEVTTPYIDENLGKQYDLEERGV